MKNILKLFNKRNLVILLLVIIVSFILFNYIKQKQQERLIISEKLQKLELDIKCAEEGKDFFFNDKSFQIVKNQITYSYTKWSLPEYHYNKKLQTCLISWEITNDVLGTAFKYGGVIDILSNKTILKSDSNPINYDSYLPVKDVLMSE